MADPRQLPILFNAEMVRQILSGAKTQTRRPAKVDGDPDSISIDRIGRDWRATWDLETSSSMDHGSEPRSVSEELRCPYGEPGRLLYVRETWSGLLVMEDGAEICAYRASCPDDTFDYFGADGFVTSVKVDKWKPSIHMPKWASRITLEVTDVRVERVQDISDADAVAEGFFARDLFPDDDPIPVSAAAFFESAWHDIYGNWDANPWVWVVSFKRVERQL